jgi:hypothetical protein
MTVNFLDYIPHGMATALGGIVAYVYRDHVKRDDSRFKDAKTDLDALGKKIDEHYVNITNILLDRLPPKREL